MSSGELPRLELDEVLRAHLVHDAVAAHAAADRVGRLDLVVGAAVAANVHRAPAQTQHQVQRALLLDVVVRERPAVLQLLAGKDQALLIRRDALFVLDLRLDVLDRVGGLDLA